ncbi:MAG: hypothetical protein ABI904_04485 [Chloroflexota bacterium]
MPQSEYRARQVGAKTNEVVNYHNDDSLPGKPLHILIPGGLIALAALGVIILIIYQTWFQNQLAQSTGSILIAILSPFYVGGVFLFSYGYELYNIPRAIRLTAIIVFVTVAAVVIVAVLALVLGDSKGSSSSSSSKSSSSKSSSSRSQSSSSSSSSSGSGAFFFGGTGGTRTVTREVVKEKTVEVPVAPRTIDCPFCQRSYVPADNKYACPACGAATPVELIEESQKPKPKGG